MPDAFIFVFNHEFVDGWTFCIQQNFVVEYCELLDQGLLFKGIVFHDQLHYLIFIGWANGRYLGTHLEY